MGEYSQRIVNLTATANILPQPDIVSNHVRFPGKTLRLQYCTVNLFRSGKLVLVGAKSNIELRSDIDALAQTFPEIADVKIRNVVCAVDFGCHINLYDMSVQLKAVYSPDMYNGLVTKLTNGATAIMFWSGKVILTGNESFAMVTESINIAAEAVRVYQQWKSKSKSSETIL